MRVLFDQGVPVPLREHLANVTLQVTTAFELGWSCLQNGQLLQQAEGEGFEVFVTTDKNLQYQQNLTARMIAIVVLSTTSWPRIQQVAHLVQEAVLSAKPGSYVVISIP